MRRPGRGLVLLLPHLVHRMHCVLGLVWDVPLVVVCVLSLAADVVVALPGLCLT